MRDKNAFTIAEFCHRQNIAPSTYFAMAREGHGPRTMLVGSRGVRISKEAEVDWRLAREEAAKAQPKAA